MNEWIDRISLERVWFDRQDILKTAKQVVMHCTEVVQDIQDVGRLYRVARLLQDEIDAIAESNKANNVARLRSAAAEYKQL